MPPTDSDAKTKGIPPGNVSPELARRLALLYNRYRIGVSSLALLLPVLVVCVGRWFGDRFDSVSAYYYSETGGIFIGFLFVLAAYFAIYGAGLETASTPTKPRSPMVFVRDVVAALAAVTVALFPTKPPSGHDLSTAVNVIATVHLFAAGLVFLILAALALGFYVRTPAASPFLRRVSFGGAVGMLLAIGWGAFQILNDGAILGPEVLALVAFGVTWLAHGINQSPLGEAIRAARQ
ncbi:MAG: hypothetical protein WED83_08175 [Acidimicrobiia bacterium]